MFELTYLIVGLFLLILTFVITYFSFYFCGKSQKELERLYAQSPDEEKKSGKINLCFVSNDIATLLSAWCLLMLVLLFWNFSSQNETSETSLNVWMCLAIFLAYLWILTSVNIAVCSNSKKHAKTKAFPFAAKIFRQIFFLMRPFLPDHINYFKVEENIVDLHEEKQVSDKSETMLKGILQFGNETVRDIMTSRLDVLDLDIKTPFSEVLQLISENSYSRIPVYSGTKDNIVGILYIKDLLPYLGKPNKFRWSFLIRPQLSVPETKKIDNLLREFQTRKIHLAVVIDEYGGVSGIVTLEDIIEEIVGEINDEYDDDHRAFVSLGKDVYVFDAKTSLQDFCKLFDLESTFFDNVEGDADTIAGLLLDLIGDFPKKHQIVCFRQFKFEILMVDERHISKVKVSIVSQEG
jgi:gliding motility-associated protein GldE